MNNDNAIDNAISRVRNALSYSIPIEEIRETLKKEGFEDGNIFLIVKAAEILAAD